MSTIVAPKSGHDTEVLIKSDEAISRNRDLRMFVAFTTPFLFIGLGGALGYIVGWWLSLAWPIGFSLGMAIGGYSATIAWARSTIVNDATIAFLTTDPIASLFPSVTKFFELTTIVIYGPGVHYCFWWEQRSADSVVNMVESTEQFNVLVQTENGDLTLEGSFWLRPDLEKLHEFINGAASVATDSTALIISSIVSRMSGQKMLLVESLREVEDINKQLDEEFRKSRSEKISAFEGRFGVTVGGVAITKIMPSEEVKKTLSAVTESDVINLMVAKSFGCADYNELFPKIGTAGGPSWALVNQVRTQMMAASGNLDKMDLKDHTFNLNVNGLNELTPEVAGALSTGLSAFMSRPGANPQKPKTQQRKGNSK